MKRYVRIFGLPLVLSAALLLSLLAPRGAAQRSKTFSLPVGVRISLPPGWVERREFEPPPPEVLAASAPDLQFSESIRLENRTAPALLQLSISANPYVGREPRFLDEQINGPVTARNSLLNSLFYFFFPPPRSCLTQAQTRLDRAIAEEVAAREAERDSDGKKTNRAPSPVHVEHACQFGPAISELYSELLSTGVRLSRASGRNRSAARLRDFYQPPMEQVEVGRRTFFVFEAEGQLQMDRETIDRYGLREDLIGSRVRYFWAFGADSPFPFYRDSARKDIQLLHLSYATLTLDGSARKEFLRLLHAIE